MKICKDCQFHKKETVQMQGQYGSILLCTHQECRDPIEGEMLPCQAARQQHVFCGIEARFFKPKEKEPEKAPVSLIQKA